MTPKKKNLKAVLLEDGHLLGVCSQKEIRSDKDKIWFEHHYRSLQEIIKKHQTTPTRCKQSAVNEGICIHNGRRIFIEVRNLDKAPREEQVIFKTIVKMTNALGAMIAKREANSR